MPPLLKLSSFGTIGAIYNSQNQGDFVRNVSQPVGVGRSGSVDFGVDSILGQQMDVAQGEDLSGMLQIVSQRREDNSFTPQLQWAFAKYYVTDILELRAGRLGSDNYMLADSRNVGYSFLWVRPPVELFGGIRNTFFDGADIVLQQRIGTGLAKFKLYGGQQSISIPAYGTFDNHGAVRLGAHAEYNSEKWRFRIGYGQITNKNENPAAIEPLALLRSSPAVLQSHGNSSVYASDLTVEGKTSRFVSAGFAYDEGPWHTQFIGTRLTPTSDVFPGYVAGYLTVGYRREKWTVYGTLSSIGSRGEKHNSGLPATGSFTALVAFENTVFSALAAAQTTQSIGLRYDFARNVDLKLQLDRLHVRNPAFWKQSETPGWQAPATLVSLAVDFIY